ncbi:MAG TPA: hypothetical protein VKY41_03125 [Xanthomarina sp.]|nr:hypothetical protein [Xanthomarina sp.]
MKKHALALFFMSLLLVATTSCKTDDDDVVKDNNEESPLTATNYIYEGDLKIFYLNTENEYLNSQIDEWSQVPEDYPDYEEAQANILVAQAQIDENELEISGILTPENAFAIVKPKLPPIPVPSPCLCLDLYNSIENIVLLPGTEQMSISILSSNDESSIAFTNSDSPLETIPNTQNTGRYQPFNFEQPGFTGQAMIEVQTNNDSYSIQVNFHNLP